MHDPYSPDANAETFQFGEYLDNLADDPMYQTLIGVPEGRRVLTMADPLLFALIYLPHHLKDHEGNITFSDAHLDWVRRARKMANPSTVPAQIREAYVAPRSTGKSTWWFLIIPLWLAAHGHIKFAAAFADSAAQAEEHLSTFKKELANNVAIREDYPKLTYPLKYNGAAVSDNRQMYQAKSGFTFGARGIDSGNLGMKVGNTRPDFIICDDLEPGEANYSVFQAEKRLATLLEVVLPLNVYARVVLVGTVTMAGSIIHQLVQTAQGTAAFDWVKTEKIKPYYYPAIIQRNDSTERSIWPEKWSMDFLNSIRTSKQYMKNYANSPLGADGDYWSAETFQYEDVHAVAHTLLSIDPAVTSKASSDFTGIAVVGYSPSARKCVVKDVREVKLAPAELRTHVLKMINADPSIGMILIETNQGGDVWTSSILHDMPVKVKTVHQSVKKEVRAAEVLAMYERGFVQHVKSHGMSRLEEQMVSFPKAPHDDMVDAVTSAVAYFRKAASNSGVSRPSTHEGSYI